MRGGRWNFSVILFFVHFFCVHLGFPNVLRFGSKTVKLQLRWQKNSQLLGQFLCVVNSLRGFLVVFRASPGLQTPMSLFYVPKGLFRLRKKSIRKALLQTLFRWLSSKINGECVLGRNLPLLHTLPLEQGLGCGFGVGFVPAIFISSCQGLWN